MERKPYATDLSDPEWSYLEPIFCPSTGKRKRGHPLEHSMREILNAIFYLIRTACQWRMLPHDFPPWDAVYYHFRKWRKDGP
ncbi:MAG: transposase [Magnetococcales bacterium]|nr:transposase [Magnetococcales bacterium]MBF0321981.1 transposase [Magnetococcales bacterium]